jgi:NAD(P)-dependent dehydrogenase (short-subunit alcohol dehydrogenase family)
MVLYLSTKGSIDIITQVLAKELGPKKIRVNSINPGGTETEGAHALGVMGSEFEKHVISQTPLGRFGQLGDIALEIQTACLLHSGGGKLQIRMVAGFSEVIERKETLVVAVRFELTTFGL